MRTVSNPTIKTLDITVGDLKNSLNRVLNNLNKLDDNLVFKYDDTRSMLPAEIGMTLVLNQKSYKRIKYGDYTSIEYKLFIHEYVE